MPLHLIGGNDPEALAAAVDRFIAGAERGGDPLLELPVAATGARRAWLRGWMARRRGVCAGVRWCAADELAAALAGPVAWDAGRCQGRLLGLLAGVPALRPALGVDAGGAPGRRSWRLAGGLAQGFARIAACRPGPRLAVDGWRAALWAAAELPDPAAEHRARCAAIRAGAVELPPRLAVFDPAWLAPATWELLAAAAERCEVLVATLSPTWGDWDWVRRQAAATAGESLLAHWGGAGRRLAAQALERGARDLRLEGLTREPPAATLLGRVQGALLRPDQPPATGPADGSLRFLSACGLRRQIEAVRHELALRCAADPGLRAHEIALLCADPAAAAPIAAAIFASPAEGPPLDLDLPAAAGADPGIDLARRLAALLPGRWEAGAVLDLAAHPLVQARHAVDLDRLRRWCRSADLRWGVDGAHQAALGLPASGVGTWRRGLLRLHLAAWHGCDHDAARWWPGAGDDPGVVPAEGIDEGDLDGIARLDALLRPLLEAAADWRTARPAAAWAEDLDRLLDHLAGPGPHRAAIAAVAGRWRRDLAEAPAVGAGVLQAAIEDAAAAPAAGGLRGGVAIGGIADLGGLPWRVAALIGMDDGAFPRQAPASDLDPIAGDPRPEDPDPRAEDRLRLLQCVVAARDAILVAWSGRDERSGDALPPAAAVRDLIAAASACCAAPVPIEVRRLHAVHEEPAAWPCEDLRAAAVAAALAAGGAADAAAAVPAMAAAAAAADDAPVVELAELLATWRRPPAAHLRHLRIALPDIDEPPRDHELFAIDGLDRWFLDQRMLAGTVRDRLGAAGWVPPPPRDRAAHLRRLGELDPLVAWWSQVRDELARVPVDLRIDGIRLVGALDGVLPGCGPVLARGAQPAARHRLGHALRTLVWRVAAGGDGGGVLAGVGRGALRRLAWVGAGDDRALLGRLLHAARAARRRPLPLMPELAAACIADGPATARSSWLARGNREAADAAVRWLWPEPEAMLAEPGWAEAAAELAPLLAADAWREETA